MSTLLTSPGVYIEEVPSGVRTLTGVATSITAFVGRALRGPVNEATEISSFGEFTRTFGNLWRDSALSYAVSHFFQNGGREALIVRVTNGAATADLSLTGGEAGSTLDLAAASPGAWGNALRVSVEIGANTANANDQRLFNLLVREVDPSDESVTVQRETFRNVTTDQNAARFVRKVLESESTLVRVKDGDIKALTMAVANDAAFKNGIDGNPLTAAQVNGDENNRSGIYALLLADLFNLLVIPPYKSDRTVDASTWTAAAKLCQDRRAVLLIDPDISWTTPKTVLDNVMGTAGLRSGLSAYAKNAAVYFPWVRIADPLSENRLELFPPSGVMAGAIARTDAARGVWKAPAGTEAGLTGVRELGAKLTDADSGDLNQKGINALRAFPVIGNVCWGARTLDGADQLTSEWKYLPVRRTALFLEESLYRGLQWVVFEPNDEPLWAQIRLNVGAFMQNLFRKGAFQGTSPREAYFVKCDSETTTQNDIDLGIVNILVGFAPLKPAEFVIVRIQQMAGQVET